MNWQLIAMCFACACAGATLGVLVMALLIADREG